MVSLLSHQVLLQNLHDILLEEFVKQPEERATPVTSDPGRATAGFLRYISMTNLAIILDLLLDSYRCALPSPHLSPPPPRRLTSDPCPSR